MHHPACESKLLTIYTDILVASSWPAATPIAASANWLLHLLIRGHYAVSGCRNESLHIITNFWALSESTFDSGSGLCIGFPWSISDCFLEFPVLPLLSVPQHSSFSIESGDRVRKWFNIGSLCDSIWYICHGIVVRN